MALAKRKPLLDPAEFDIEPLANHPEYRAAAEELAALEGRLRETEARERQAKARRRSARPSRSVVDRARDLLGGGTVQAFDADAELAACGEETAILTAAITEQAQRIEEIVGRLSFEQCQRFLMDYNAGLIMAFEGMETMWRGLDAVFALVAKLRGAGYRPTTVSLPSPAIPGPALQLGDPGQFSTESARFKRSLVSLGVMRQ